MSGLEVVAAVSAVVSAFHGGAELCKHIRKKHQKRKDKQKQALKEELLEDSLKSGEQQVMHRNAVYCQELEERFKVGDSIARDRLLHIAVVMQAEIIRSLQIAVQYENAILDLTMLHEASITNRNETIFTLDQLRQRLLIAAPILPTLQLPEDAGRRASMDSIGTYLTANSMTPEFVPAAVTLAPPEPEQRGGLQRFLSRNPSSGDKTNIYTTQNNTHLSLKPDIGWLLPAIPRDEQDLTAGFLRRMSTLQIQPDHAHAPSRPSLQLTDNSSDSGLNGRQDSLSTRSTDSEKIALSTGSASPKFYTPEAPLPLSNSRLDPQPIGFSYFAPEPLNIRKASNSSATRPSPSPNSTPSSLRTSTIEMPPSSNRTLASRPCRDNNYWGFCKGAWGTRDELKKGLKVQTRPEGMYSTAMYWQCRHCYFQGSTFGDRKHPVTDPRVHTSGCGVRYRWVFLAKSHAKVGSRSFGDGDRSAQTGVGNFGCLFCSVESRSTAVYGDVETLMYHIFLEHANPGEDVAERTECIVGREAGSGERFDINIPFVAEVQGG